MHTHPCIQSFTLICKHPHIPSLTHPHIRLHIHSLTLISCIHSFTLYIYTDPHTRSLTCPHMQTPSHSYTLCVLPYTPSHARPGLYPAQQSRAYIHWHTLRHKRPNVHPVPDTGPPQCYLSGKVRWHLAGQGPCQAGLLSSGTGASRCSPWCPGCWAMRSWTCGRAKAPLQAGEGWDIDILSLRCLPANWEGEAVRWRHRSIYRALLQIQRGFSAGMV